MKSSVFEKEFFLKPSRDYEQMLKTLQAARYGLQKKRGL